MCLQMLRSILFLVIVFIVVTCIKKISISDVNKFTDLCIAQGEVVETVKEHYASLKHHASECIACGNCMKNCPFAVDIITKMKKAVEIFGY